MTPPSLKEVLTAHLVELSQSKEELERKIHHLAMELEPIEAEHRETQSLIANLGAPPDPPEADEALPKRKSTRVNEGAPPKRTLEEVRDILVTIKNPFTKRQLALTGGWGDGSGGKVLVRYLEYFLEKGIVRDTGETFRGGTLYEYVKPTADNCRAPA